MKQWVYKLLLYKYFTITLQSKIYISSELLEDQKRTRQNFHTTKYPYGEISLRRNFLRQTFQRRNFLAPFHTASSPRPGATNPDITHFPQYTNIVSSSSILIFTVLCAYSLLVFNYLHFCLLQYSLFHNQFQRSSFTIYNPNRVRFPSLTPISLRIRSQNLSSLFIDLQYLLYGLSVNSVINFL